MKNRLNVTEAERLCYSRRRLEAISALRSAGIDPSVYGLHKEHRVPGVRGKVYLVQHPDGTLYHFSTLYEIRVYAAEYQTWTTQTRFTWDEWRKAPPKAPPKRPTCSWTDCTLDADGVIDSQPFCRAHAFIYGQIRLARDNLKSRDTARANPSPRPHIHGALCTKRRLA